MYVRFWNTPPLLPFIFRHLRTFPFNSHIVHLKLLSYCFFNFLKAWTPRIWCNYGYVFDFLKGFLLINLRIHTNSWSSTFFQYRPSHLKIFLTFPYSLSSFRFNSEAHYFNLNDESIRDGVDVYIWWCDLLSETLERRFGAGLESVNFRQRF